MARSDPQVNIRMPSYLKSLLEKASEGNRRSLNQEIIDRLEQSFGGVTSHISPRHQRLLERYASKNRISIDESMHRLLDAGSNPDAPAVVVLQIEPGTDVSTLTAALGVLEKRAPKKTIVNVEMPTKEPDSSS